MKKEDLKAAIKANFENNEFATAMELNKDLFQEYENVAESLMKMPREVRVCGGRGFCHI